MVVRPEVVGVVVEVVIVVGFVVLDGVVEVV